MPVLPRIASLARTLFRRGRLDRELDEELRAAVGTLSDRYRDQGMTPAQAERAARLAMGGVEQVKEHVRAGRIGAGIDASLQDVRYAWRVLWKAPAFTAAVIVTLALGIGANAAIFSVVHAMLLAPLPYRDSDRLVFVWSDMTDTGYPRAPLSGPELKDLRERSTTCSGFGAIWSNTTALTGEGDPEQLRVGFVTADFFQVLGAEPALGRTFRPEDSAPGARPTILLAWSVFQRPYAADPSLVGREILVNDRPATVIGVLPQAFRLLLALDAAVPDDLQAWQPFGPNLERGPRGQQYLRVIGRMRPGVTVEQARQDISGIARRISREFTEYGAAGRIFTTVPLHDDGVREIRPAFAVTATPPRWRPTFAPPSRAWIPGSRFTTCVRFRSTSRLRGPRDGSRCSSRPRLQSWRCCWRVSASTACSRMRSLAGGTSSGCAWRLARLRRGWCTT